MKNLYLDINTGDLEVYNGNFRFTETDTEFVAQKIGNHLKTFKGEFWLNVDLGIPYVDSEDRRDKTKNIIGVNPDMNVVRAVFLKELNSIDEVKRVLNLSFEKDDVTKVFTINWTVSLSDNNVLSRSTVL